MTAYYNEMEPFAASWLEELIAAGAIAPGEVDRRDIRDVAPDDLRGFTQCHFFAGIGVWSYGLRRAGWPDDRAVWTGSCPCQPFSAAGQGGGFDDERHLWPYWHHLLRLRRPPEVFAEQVSSPDGLAWLDLVQADMEGEDYALGAQDICAAGVGAPTLRQRLYVAAYDLRASLRGMDHATGARCEGARQGPEGEARDETRLRGFEPGCGLGGVACPDSGQRRGITDGEGREPDGQATRRLEGDGEPQSGQLTGLLGNAEKGERGLGQPETGGQQEVAVGGRGFSCLRSTRDWRPGPVNGEWGDADWLLCRDGRWRPVEPGSFPLVDGASARVGRLRGYGNALNAENARLFVKAYLDAEEELRAAA